MMNLTAKLQTIKNSEYAKQFWNMARLKTGFEPVLSNAMVNETGAYILPGESRESFREAIQKESLFRSYMTVIRQYGGASLISFDHEDNAEFIPEGAEIPGIDLDKSVKRMEIKTHKLAGLIKVSSDFVRDAAFDLKEHILTRFAKSFARKEDRAFIQGTGTEEPTGMLHPTQGAKTGLQTAELTFDACLKLFFALDKDYRKNAVWVMNDQTALVLRSLKSSDGQYLWNHAEDKILGKPVLISNDMPDIALGQKPVLFGDLSYYWIMERAPMSLKALKERFVLMGLVGYIGYELLDGKLIRPEAVQALSVSGG